MRKIDKKISIIIPVHDEEANIPLVYAELTRVFAALPYSYEIIFIDDGSKDASREAVK